MWNKICDFSVCATCFYILTIFYKSISIKYRLREYITILSSKAHEFCNFTTSKIVTDLHDAQREKFQTRDFQSLDDPVENSSKTVAEKSKKLFI